MYRQLFICYGFLHFHACDKCFGCVSHDVSSCSGAAALQMSPGVVLDPGSCLCTSSCVRMLSSSPSGRCDSPRALSKMRHKGGNPASADYQVRESLVGVQAHRGAVPAVLLQPRRLQHGGRQCRPAKHGWTGSPFACVAGPGQRCRGSYARVDTDVRPRAPYIARSQCHELR